VRRIVFNSHFLLQKDTTPNESFRARQLGHLVPSERRRFGIDKCKTAEDVKLVRRAADTEATRLRRTIRALDVQRFRLEPVRLEALVGGQISTTGS
jgi:hypothetical protein